MQRFAYNKKYFNILLPVTDIIPHSVFVFEAGEI